MPRLRFVTICLLILSTLAIAQTAPDPLAPYIAVSAPVIALTHVEVIDGTGAAALADQTLVIDHGKIASIGPSASAQAPAGAKILDLRGHSVFPGLVGMHEHLFYTEPGSRGLHQFAVGEALETAPRLYLAAGVTTARTTGSVEPYADLNIKKEIDAGKIPGPDLDVTGPYLEGSPALILQLHALTGPEDARNLVNYWAAEGATSWKAYMDITRDELKAAIEAAHAHGQKITGHLCSIGFTEGADMGIDNLEHGMFVDTEFYSGKKPGICPDEWRMVEQEMAGKLDMSSEPVMAMIHDLVRHHVAVTSTLSAFDMSAPNHPPMKFLMRERGSMMPQAWSSVLGIRAQIAEHADTSYWPALLKKEMQFEREFVAAGGLLMAGCDPTGYGAILPGFGDELNLELLVEAGFTPVQAIQIYTQNGAKYLGREDRIGTIAAGKQADLVVVAGDAAKNISAVEAVETVFKKGVGYNSQKLIESAEGMVGIR
ncbi:MAG: amidohydrolase family protein [Acidobacteriaceae bacterium]